MDSADILRACDAAGVNIDTDDVGADDGVEEGGGVLPADNVRECAGVVFGAAKVRGAMDGVMVVTLTPGGGVPRFGGGVDGVTTILGAGAAAGNDEYCLINDGIDGDGDGGTDEEEEEEFADTDCRDDVEGDDNGVTRGLSSVRSSSSLKIDNVPPLRSIPMDRLDNGMDGENDGVGGGGPPIVRAMLIGGGSAPTCLAGTDAVGATVFGVGGNGDDA